VRNSLNPATVAPSFSEQCALAASTSQTSLLDSFTSQPTPSPLQVGYICTLSTFISLSLNQLPQTSLVCALPAPYCGIEGSKPLNGCFHYASRKMRRRRHPGPREGPQPARSPWRIRECRQVRRIVLLSMSLRGARSDDKLYSDLHVRGVCRCPSLGALSLF
jgi:hypothetical protein